ncbi:MAG TPA: helix-turn-helix domain-containing protein, partial [Solirubrobacteraceae bacterium]|nr:helix-turn-helix domain-containing protein [Solirubrobacteraceae bacterium]
WESSELDVHGHLGLLVLDGLLTRRETIGALDYTELLGTGDLLRPWTVGSHATLLTAANWEVLVPTRIAILDRDFALRARPWPEIVATLLDRAVMRSRSLGVILAIHRAVRVEERLELMLWHLADRWGHVTPEGVVVPIALTHDSLGKLIGARRSPVTVGLGNLKRDGVVRRGQRGSWILSAASRPAPPDANGA